ncbi:MAG: DUF2752 domain-containing protein [Marinirhabdus sp.]
MFFLKGLDDMMLPCLNKQLFGVECLGCGMQRATILVFRGEFAAAFTIYPAIYTLFVLGVFLLFNLFIKFKYGYAIKVGLIAVNVLLIIVGYVLKMKAYL